MQKYILIRCCFIKVLSVSLTKRKKKETNIVDIYERRVLEAGKEYGIYQILPLILLLIFTLLCAK